MSRADALIIVDLAQAAFQEATGAVIRKAELLPVEERTQMVVITLGMMAAKFAGLAAALGNSKLTAALSQIAEKESASVGDVSHWHGDAVAMGD